MTNWQGWCILKYKQRDRREYNKEYWKRNGSKIVEKRRSYQKQYYEDNKETLLRAMKDRYESDPLARKEESRRYWEVNGASRRAKQYGKSEDEIVEMLTQQAGKCAICERVLEVVVIDHDHACCAGDKRSCGNCVRGLLCRICNTSLGGFKDSIHILLRAIMYLVSYSIKRSTCLKN